MKKIIVALLGLCLFVVTIQVFAYRHHPNEIQEHFRLLNEYRESLGLSRLILNEELSRCSQKYVERQLDNNAMGHYAPPGASVGRNPMDRCGYVTYGGVGENALASQGYIPNGAQALALRKTSKGHDANMRTPQWRYVGIAAISNDNGLNSRRLQTFTDGPLRKDGIPTGENISKENVPLSDLISRNIKRANFVETGGKKLIRIQIQLNYEYDQLAKTSEVSRDILTTLQKKFNPL